MEAARAAVRTIESQSNSVYRYTLLRVVEASKQVVAGIKYRLVLDAAPTTCTKDQAEADCAGSAAQEGKAARYHVTVLSQPWRKPAFQVEVGEVEQI